MLLKIETVCDQFTLLIRPGLAWFTVLIQEFLGKEGTMATSVSFSTANGISYKCINCILKRVI